MTENEINKTIAIHCGWTFREDTYGKQRLMCPAGHKCPPYDGDGFEAQYCETPNYCHDLNAINEAEMTLSDQQKRSFIRLLHHSTGDMVQADWQLLHSSAFERAQTFVKVIKG